MIPHISAKTVVCMVIGDPIFHSLSPCIHNAGYAATNLSQKFVFVAHQVTAESLEDALIGVRALGIRGVSVTLPHKESVIPFLDSLDPSADRCGAVNTIVNNGGHLIGYNTDVEGVLAPLRNYGALSNKKVLVVGAGGAARAAVSGLSSEGAHITIANRSLAHAEHLAFEFGAEYVNLLSLSSLKEFEFIIHATSVGMTPHPDESLIPKELFTPQHLIFDLVYTPLETLLLRNAREMGAKVIPGCEMLVAQAAKQFELYTGIPGPVDVFRESLMTALRDQQK